MNHCHIGSIQHTPQIMLYSRYPRSLYLLKTVKCTRLYYAGIPNQQNKILPSCGTLLEFVWWLKALHIMNVLRHLAREKFRSFTL